VLNQSGSTITVGYGGDGGIPDTSLEFTPTSDNSATLPTGQQRAGIEIVCVSEQSGPGLSDPGFGPSVAQLASGSLTYNAGTLFLSVIGTVEAPGAYGQCASLGEPVAFIITCSDDTGADGGASEADLSAGPSGSAFVGVYECTPAIWQVQPGNPGGESGTSGSSTLTITQTGRVLTATLGDNLLFKGSLEFVATTSNAAVPAAPNQTMQVTCVDGEQNSLSVASSTLTIDDSSVVLSFAGSGCGGYDIAGSLLCASRSGGSTGDASASDASHIEPGGDH
jgi:hypothetical protein